MKKKGFTLVELLAVIAILAILVIVAMPNVLGMFNQAKANTFVTEVQEYMNTATTSFMQSALTSKGKTLYFGNGTTGDCNSSEPGDQPCVSLGKLDMSGTEKHYFIQMDRNGEFERVIVYDDNFCYDSKKTSPKADADGKVDNTDPNNYTDLKGTGIEKTTISVTDVYETDPDDTVDVTALSGFDATVVGCAAKQVAQQ
jgi:prepilin-type N-terminal cleavage/methylation domain-containing protein